MLTYLPAIGKRLRSFDFFGFAMLSLGVGALQLMLDRGAEVDWFSAAEIWIELGLALTGFWVFIVHTMTAEHPFIDPKIFADRNFVTGLVFIFVIGIILLASLALLPPMLSHIFDYPTITTGVIMAPRGVGTMVSMIVVGRIIHRVDARYLVVLGLLPDGIFALRDDRLHAADGQLPDHRDRHRAGAGARPGVRAAVDGCLRHARFALQHRRGQPFQPGAQPRLVDRHLDRDGRAGAQRADQPRRAGGGDHAVQPDPDRGDRRERQPATRRR